MLGAKFRMDPLKKGKSAAEWERVEGKLQGREGSQPRDLEKRRVQKTGRAHVTTTQEKIAARIKHRTFEKKIGRKGERKRGAPVHSRDSSG